MPSLISFIGVGKRDHSGKTYFPTTYDFGGGTTCHSPMFFNALMESQKFNIEQCLIIGTTTSSWASLIDQLFDDHMELYEQIQDSTEGDSAHGITADALQDLEKVLHEHWGIPISCYAHPFEINESNVLNILLDYFKVISTQKETDLIVDITHGLRTMPIMLMTALQFNDVLTKEALDVSLIYGEYKKIGASPVRYMKPIWEGMVITRHIKAFLEKFDGLPLSNMMKEQNIWQEGANAIARFGNMVQSNFVTQLDDRLRELKNALKTIDLQGLPAWVEPVANELEQLHKQLSKPKRLHGRIKKLAVLLAERGLYGQAVIALMLSFEAFVFYYYDQEEEYGDYYATKKLGKTFKKEIKEIDKKMHEKIIFLETTRNGIAHGGAEKNGSKPSSVNLPNQFESYKKNLEQLFELKP